jgi:hypothetical protein
VLQIRTWDEILQILRKFAPEVDGILNSKTWAITRHFICWGDSFNHILEISPCYQLLNRATVGHPELPVLSWQSY